MNNKGVLRVKLLTIIIIVGILLFVVAPKIIVYFENNKNTKYIEVAKEYINEVKASINALEYKQIPMENEVLLVKLSDLNINKKSPYGSFKKDYSYVVVLNCGNYYDYYFASIDTSLHGIPLVNEKELSSESIVYGENNLSNINRASKIENLYVANTVYTKSEKTQEDDKNVLLVPVSGELSVSYEFKKDVHKMYSDIVKNINTDIYNKEVVINSGQLKYDNKVLSSRYNKNINGLFRYISFPNNEKEEYYASFITYTNSYVAGNINSIDNYSSKNMVFDSLPTIVINESSSTVIDNNKKYLMWNLMSIYPNNNNYVVTDCGALIIKNTQKEMPNITFDTPGVLIGKSNNNCELGNIFAIRKDNVKTNDEFYARGYIKYKDHFGREHISYSRNTILGKVG